MDNTNLKSIIEEQLDPKIITALYKNFKDQYNALFELLDNAVDDRVEGETLLIDIYYEGDKLIIKNMHGNGMSLEQLTNFFRWGASGKNSKIGRFGQGGKAALGYLANNFIIKSYPLNDNKYYNITVNNWENRDNGLKKFRVEEGIPFSDQSKGSVFIEISKLKKHFDDNTIKRKIIDYYRPLILLNKVKFIYNGEILSCLEVNYDEGTKKEFLIPIAFLGTEKFTIFGYYGIVSDINSLRGGFNIYQHGRRVSKKEYFGLVRPEKSKFSLERLYGELYINFDLPLLLNKTDIDRNSTKWKLIEAAMQNEIKEIHKQAIDYKTPTSAEQQNVKKITQKVKKFKTSTEQKTTIDVANYGSNLLFKIQHNKNNEEVVVINRQHPAYIHWCVSSRDGHLYNVMIYSLYNASQKLSKKESSQFLQAFSEALKINAALL